MTYLPFSNRFEKIFSESKELSSTWKAGIRGRPGPNRSKIFNILLVLVRSGTNRFWSVDPWWKVYEVEIRKVAGVISEYDRQIEAIKRACIKDGEIYPYCPGKLRVCPRLQIRINGNTMFLYV